MTLILASKPEEYVDFSADGLSVSEQLQAPGRTTLQKLFPLTPHCMALAQCGSNFLQIAGRRRLSFAAAVASWSTADLPTSLRDAAHYVRNRLQRADPEFFGRTQSMIWIGGFSDRVGRPQLFCITELGCHEAAGQFHSAGAGSRFLQGQMWTEHDEAWAIAEAEQLASRPIQVFGGHRHKLRVTRTGCEWIVRPFQGSLGISQLLPTLNADVNSQSGQDPSSCIRTSRIDLQSALCRRALKGNGRHPSTYQGARQNWATEGLPEQVWELANRLIAISDEADVADPADVSDYDAELYRTHANHLIRRLPEEVRST